MLATETTTNYGTVSMEAFEFELPCDETWVRQNECTQAAEWVLLYDCGHSRQFCTEHKDKTIEFAQNPITPGWCGQCRNERGVTHYIKILAIQPIRGV